MFKAKINRYASCTIRGGISKTSIEKLGLRTKLYRILLKSSIDALNDKYKDLTFNTHTFSFFLSLSLSLT